MISIYCEKKAAFIIQRKTAEFNSIPSNDKPSALQTPASLHEKE